MMVIDINSADSIYKELYDVAINSGCEALFDAPLKDYVTFKTGGVCGLLVTPKTEDALVNILKAVNEKNIPVTVLGNGSNVLVPDSGVNGVVVRTADGLTDLRLLDENRIYCSAGVKLAALCNFAYENSLSGIEFAFGIPGTAGGAAFMNGGAYGGQMSDVITSVHHIDSDFNKGVYALSEIGYGYRQSAYIDNGYIITAIEIELKKDEKSAIKARMDDFLARRKDKQPLEYPSAGSTFKRPEGNFAGALIEQCGLKGTEIGGARVSEKHAGFIINTGNATSADILSLIDYVKKDVKEKTGVLLEPEVRILR